MLRIACSSRQDQLTLRQWQDQATPHLAQRARFILWVHGEKRPRLSRGKPVSKRAGGGRSERTRE